MYYYKYDNDIKSCQFDGVKGIGKCFCFGYGDDYSQQILGSDVIIGS